MKEWQELLLYVDQYVYVEGEEEIIIKYGPDAENAQLAYERGRSILNEKDDEDDFWGSGTEKWEFDIALDCIRKMSESDRDYVRNHMQTTEYHFGYAMGIRNQYIHPSKKHHVFMADSVSSSIMRKIFSILSPVYDYRDSIITGFYEDFSMSNLVEYYGETQKAIFDMIVERLQKGGVYSSAKEAVQDLKNELRKALGSDEFIRILAKALEDYEQNESKNDREDWYWETNFPSCKAMLYPLESKQANVLRKMGFFRSVAGRQLKSLEECRCYIDENLGLRDDYADYMARCAWEICNPLTNGKWRELNLYQLNLDYSVRNQIEKAGFKTLGDICNLRYERLARISGVGIENADKIKKELEGMGLSLK